MLDVARHFLPVSKILRTIDAMESAKLNVLHLHLTDSQVRVTTYVDSVVVIMLC